jgi:polar amino acid transport system substrate-binding protein
VITRVAILATSAVAALALAGCASGGSSGSGGANGTPESGAGASTAPSNACSPATMHTHTAGTLAVGTDSPAYEPWFVGNKPTNGKGFESAVAYAVARRLGYQSSQVKWIVAPFNSVIAPTPKKFDFDINEVSITPQRAKVVDFSSGYYDVAQAVVALKSNKYANASTIADLKGAKLGAQKGTTSFDAINNTGRTPLEYPTNDLAVQALKNGQIDGLLVDLPTGLYVTSAQISNAKIVGQLPVTGTPEQFGLVLDHSSALTSCVTQAVNALRANGTLGALQKKWLTTSAGAPELK